MKRIKVISIITVALLVHITASSTTPPVMMHNDSIRKEAYKYADQVIEKLTQREMLAQLIMPMISPKTDSIHVAQLDQIINTGFGGILWQKGDPQSQLVLTNRMRERAKVGMLVAMDGEWGLAMRLSNTIFWPRNMQVAATADLLTAFEYGRATAKEAKRMGIHINFAPVADVNNNPKNPVIGTRSFGSDPHQVAKMVIAYAQGLESNGVLSVAKHFPGHGDTEVDSHLALPELSQSQERLEEIELVPFRAYIDSGLGGIMVGHLTVPALDSTKKAASISPTITTEYLQKELGFGGLICTDGLNMRGVLKSAEGKSVVVEAFKAGNDILLAPWQIYESLNELTKALESGEIELSEVTRRCRKVLAWKYILGATDNTPIPLDGLIEEINSTESKALLAKIQEQSLTLLKNNRQVLPLHPVGRQAILRYGKDNSSHLISQLQRGRGTRTDVYSVSNDTLPLSEQMLEKLKTYDRVLVLLTSEEIQPTPLDLSGLEAQEVIIVCMTSPYTLLHFSEALKRADVIAIGYSGHAGSERAMGRALLGKLPFRGQLPVDLFPLFRSGDGITLPSATQP